MTKIDFDKLASNNNLFDDEQEVRKKMVTEKNEKISEKQKILEKGKENLEFSVPYKKTNNTLINVSEQTRKIVNELSMITGTHKKTIIDSIVYKFYINNREKISRAKKKILKNDLEL